MFLHQLFVFFCFSFSAKTPQRGITAPTTINSIRQQQKCDGITLINHPGITIIQHALQLTVVMQRCHRQMSYARKLSKLVHFRVSAWHLTLEKLHNIHQCNHNGSVQVWNGPLSTVTTSSLWAQVAWREHPWRQSHPESWLNTRPGRSRGNQTTGGFPTVPLGKIRPGYKSDLCSFYIQVPQSLPVPLMQQANAATTDCISSEKEKKRKSLTVSTVYPKRKSTRSILSRHLLGKTLAKAFPAKRMNVTRMSSVTYRSIYDRNVPS